VSLPTEPNQFAPHRRILQTLIGSNLYPDKSVVLRELVQNAVDAIEWRTSVGEGDERDIAVTYSAQAGWFEVADIGIGMDLRDVKESLLQVGRNKYEALGENPQAEQVALFGIGFLSVFLVAERVTLWTKKDGAEALRIEITRIDGPVLIDPDPDNVNVGTRVRVLVDASSGFRSDSVPEALRRYVRHVQGVRLISADTNESEVIDESWETASLWAVEEAPRGPEIRSGRTGFAEGLRTSSPIGNRFVLCNAGFLVEERALDLVQLPPGAGFSGELDLHPGGATIVMARERFQRDPEWETLGRVLSIEFVRQASAALSAGELAPTDALDSSPVKRAILIWESQLPDDPDLVAFKQALRDRIWTTVPFQVAELGARSLAVTASKLPTDRLYVRRTAAPATTTRSVDDEGSPVQFMEEIRYSVRVGALRARGFEVVEVGQVQVTLENQRNATAVNIEEDGAVRRICQERSIEVLDVAQAPPEDLNLDAIEVLPVLQGFLEVAGGLRFARIPDSQRRVVADPSGLHYLNVDAPAVGRLLDTIPGAVGNPLRRRLLEIYLALEDFNFVGARNSILDLLESKELASLAAANVAPLTQDYIAKAVEAVRSD
jgi:hypothetical protein